MSVFVSSLVLALHLLCMNVAAAGPLLCVWLDRKAGNHDREARAAVRYLAIACCCSIILGAVLGVVMGWLQWSDSYRQLLARFAPRISWGLLEFAFSAVLLVAYAIWIAVQPVSGLAVWFARALLAVLAATNLLYHFPPLFSMLAGAAAGQYQLDGAVNSATFLQLLFRGDVLSLTTHFALASFAVAGALLIAFGSGLVGPTDRPRGQSAVWGARTALAATLVQIPVGLWVMVQMPAQAQQQLMGGDLVSSTLLVSAVLVTFWLMHQLAAVAWGDDSRRTARRAILAMVAVVMLMSLVLQRTKPRPTLASRDNGEHLLREEHSMSIECVTLKDPQSPAIAVVAAGFGFNCFQFAVERNGRRIDVLWAAPDFAAGTARPSGSGIPILFPFPGRIAGGLLHWEGRDYQLPQGDGRGNAIHGFVLNRGWRVIEQAENRVTGEFHAAQDAAQLLELWPADFRIRATYSLLDAKLSCRLRIDNPDQRPLPCGLGTHPYFRVPVGGNQAESCIVSLPVTEQWELVDLLPTGRRLPLSDADAYRRGAPFGGLQLDNVFTGLQLQGERHLTTIFDPHSRIRVEQEFDRIFRECVVYTPPHREAVCIEPYTCVPGAFELAAQGTDAGVRIVPGGGSFIADVDITVR